MIDAQKAALSNCSCGASTKVPLSGSVKRSDDSRSRENPSRFPIKEKGVESI
jgi:hypothetical protein